MEKKKKGTKIQPASRGRGVCIDEVRAVFKGLSYRGIAVLEAGATRRLAVRSQSIIVLLDPLTNVFQALKDCLECKEKLRRFFSTIDQSESCNKYTDEWNEQFNYSCWTSVTILTFFLEMTLKEI